VGLSAQIDQNYDSGVSTQNLDFYLNWATAPDYWECL